MASVTYYFPSNYGAAVPDTTGGEGQNPFPAGGLQYADGYTKVYVPDTTQANYIVTVGYDSTTVAPQQFSVTQSQYSNSDHNEVVTDDGSADFFLQTSPYNTSQAYTFSPTSSAFTPNASFETAPAPVSPTEDFAHDYQVTPNGDGTFQVATGNFFGSYTIQDYKDPGTSDDLAQLGDVSTGGGDHFSATSDTTGDLFKTIYYGKTSNGGVVATDGAGDYYFYTNSAYTAGENFAADTSPDALCFASGTRISTMRGEIAVERVEVGDIVLTASGAQRPVRWIGHREMDGANAPLPFEVRPVRIRAGAFGGDLPHRDLYLSPGHPVLVGTEADGTGGHLVPIMCLINGTTIERVPVESVTYWHVELDAHDILLAEGLPAESYIDLGSRPWFDGAAGALYDPDIAAPGMPGRCRPVAADGAVVEAERRRLDGVFAMSLSAASYWPEYDTFAAI